MGNRWQQQHVSLVLAITEVILDFLSLSRAFFYCSTCHKDVYTPELIEKCDCKNSQQQALGNFLLSLSLAYFLGVWRRRERGFHHWEDKEHLNLAKIRPVLPTGDPRPDNWSSKAVRQERQWYTFVVAQFNCLTGQESELQRDLVIGHTASQQHHQSAPQLCRLPVAALPHHTVIFSVSAWKLSPSLPTRLSLKLLPSD